jgi:ABC-type branched-subunit amino acid transport system ATPase component
MLRNLRITNFRGLREFAMSGLGRVNLLVGTNNCGKTSVLEAIHMLSVPGSAVPLWQAQVRRGELIDSATERQIDVAHLVHGHKLVAGPGFYIGGDGTRGFQKLTASFVTRSSTGSSENEEEEDEASDAAAEPGAIEPLLLHLEWRDGPSFERVNLPTRKVQLPLTRRGGGVLRPTIGGNVHGLGDVSFITTEGLTRDNTISMFERVVLTPAESTVLGALHTIEPGIERIASVGTYARSSRDARGGLAMMVAGQRIPIGSMGDGIWRLLGVALALVQAREGVLLVDEIDTGLHYSVLVDMWRLVLATARSLDVQVFATTHSRDCYEALAAVTEANRDEISLQRIERGKIDAVAFSEAELRQAAERGLEVR